MPHRTRTSTIEVLTTLVALGSIPSVSGALSGQAHPGSAAPEEIREIQSISPSSGPPGTVVSVNTLNLPYEARIHIGVGAMGAGFEAIAEAPQGRLGEIAARVEVPASAPQDRPIVFIAFNAIFAPIGMSAPFHVTDAEGKIHRTGRIVSVEDGCVLFRDRDGYEYELTQGTGELTAGDEVDLGGVFFEGGRCADMTIGVTDVRERGSPGYAYQSSRRKRSRTST